MKRGLSIRVLFISFTFHSKVQTGSPSISLRQYEREILDDRMVGSWNDRATGVFHVYTENFDYCVILFSNIQVHERCIHLVPLSAKM